MAKQCLYCGRPLAKDDARFCNDCGRLQVAPINAASGAAGPSAIKVKLPPKEYARDEDLSSPQQETSLPGSMVSSPPVFPAPREHVLPPSSRMPKRPTRLKPQAPSISVDRAKPAGEPLSVDVRVADQSPPVSMDKAEPAGEPLIAEFRFSDSAPASEPTPAEEASTMVLPNWREELALLRKEQEQVRADSSVGSEKKPERAAKEPPPLPRRSSAGTPLPPGKVGGENPRPPQARQAPNTPLPPPVNARSVELPRQAPDTPQPQNSAHPVEAPRWESNTPLPPQENARPAEVSRRELRVKVWEQETTIRSSPDREEKRAPGPAPAVEKNPFASAAFGAEEQLVAGEELESITWQAPLSPIPAGRNQPPAREEKHSSIGEEVQTPAREEKRPQVGEERQLAREERRQPADDESDQQTVKKAGEGIEDLPTVPLAVPEIAKQEPPIKVERASTPAPKKWAAPRAGDVEDQPTRPMAASSSGAAAPHSPQQPLVPRLEGDRAEAASPLGQKSANPPSSSGGDSVVLVAQPMGQVAGMDVDPLAFRARSAHPTSQSGLTFDPASLPPLPPGPLPLSGNAQPHPEMPGPQGPQPRSLAPFPDAPAQRSPAFEPPPVSVSSPADASKPAAEASRVTEGKKPRKKRHTGRLVVVIVLLLVLAGGGVGVALNWDWVMQYFQTPTQNQPYQTYQNSSLGVSLDYTQDWSVNIDQVHSIVHFADSSHTGQANLTMATAGGQVNEYLNQQVTLLGVTGPKTAPAATIGGSNWLVVQGTVTQSGATYTAMLYATQHNGHFYMLEFLAPQSSFKQVDQSDFAHMRASFKFL